MKRPTWTFGLLAALITSTAGGYYWGPAKTPQGQPALTEITPQTLEDFRAAFNQSDDRLRIVALLSPT